MPGQDEGDRPSKGRGDRLTCGFTDGWALPPERNQNVQPEPGQQFRRRRPGRAPGNMANAGLNGQLGCHGTTDPR